MRTAGLPFTRSTATCSVRASCTNATRHRTDSTRCAGLSRAPFHETFHAEGRQWSMTATERSDLNPSQRHLNLTTWSNRTGHRFGSTAPPNCALSGSRRLRCAPPLARRQRRALPWEARSAHAGPRIAGTRRPRWLSGQPPGAATSRLPWLPRYGARRSLRTTTPASCADPAGSSLYQRGGHPASPGQPRSSPRSLRPGHHYRCRTARSTATCSRSRQPQRTPAPAASWNVSQTRSGAASSGRRGAIAGHTGC